MDHITSEVATLIGALAALVAELNETWHRARQYTMEYYGGKYIWIYWRPEVLARGDERETVVPRDTPVTEENLIAAINRVQDEIEEAA